MANKNEKTTTALATKTPEELEAAKKREELKAIKSVEDIINAFGGKVVEVREFVGDFALVDSEELVGVPFMVAHYDIRKSDDYGHFDDESGLFVQGEYASVYIITEDGKNQKLVFNDGGLGIIQVLKNFTEETGQTGGMRCTWGLRSSSYETVKNGQKIQATTMYFATSKPKKS